MFPMAVASNVVSAKRSVSLDAQISLRGSRSWCRRFNADLRQIAFCSQGVEAFQLEPTPDLRWNRVVKTAKCNKTFDQTMPVTVAAAVSVSRFCSRSDCVSSSHLHCGYGVCLFVFPSEHVYSSSDVLASSKCRESAT